MINQTCMYLHKVHGKISGGAYSILTNLVEISMTRSLVDFGQVTWC